MTGGDPFAGFDLERRIATRARACGLELSAGAIDALCRHARAVLLADRHLHLTAIREPHEFLERHIGESLEGAALLPAGRRGRLLDLGSGNGYPGLAVAAARPGLTPLLAEASARKAAFLRSTGAACAPGGGVLDRQVQRIADLDDYTPFSVVLSRAMGGWEKILPRLVSGLTDDGVVLLWAGEEVARIATRRAWSRLRLTERRPLPGREHSWIWRFDRAPDSSVNL